MYLCMQHILSQIYIWSLYKFSINNHTQTDKYLNYNYNQYIRIDEDYYYYNVSICLVLLLLYNLANIFCESYF